VHVPDISADGALSLGVTA